MEKVKSCEHCGALFNYERSTAKFCSGACKQQAHNEGNSKIFASLLDTEDVVIETLPEEPTNNEIIVFSPTQEPEPQEVETIVEPNPSKADYFRKIHDARRERLQAQCRQNTARNYVISIAIEHMATSFFNNIGAYLEKNSNNGKTYQTTPQPIDLNPNTKSESPKEANSISESENISVENAESKQETLSNSASESHTQARTEDLLEIQTDYVLSEGELTINDKLFPPVSFRKLIEKVHNWFTKTKLLLRASHLT